MIFAENEIDMKNLKEWLPSHVNGSCVIGSGESNGIHRSPGKQLSL